ncbi:MAG TPA: hypothetical protein VEK57_28010 [Thermoanaerobaculia bacterium]|nr:hypothetical protein [Thermoanaerobaculia bacterium]
MRKWLAFVILAGSFLTFAQPAPRLIRDINTSEISGSAPAPW